MPDITTTSNTQNLDNDHASLEWNQPNELTMQIARTAQVIVRNGQLCVIGKLRLQQENTPTGDAVTFTNLVQPLQLGTGAKLGALPGNGNGPPYQNFHAGWLRVLVGNTPAAVPYWI